MQIISDRKAYVRSVLTCYKSPCTPYVEKRYLSINLYNYITDFQALEIVNIKGVCELASGFSLQTTTKSPMSRALSCNEVRLSFRVRNRFSSTLSHSFVMRNIFQVYWKRRTLINDISLHTPYL